jgi:hypothetical protein
MFDLTIVQESYLIPLDWVSRYVIIINAPLLLMRARACGDAAIMEKI